MTQSQWSNKSIEEVTDGCGNEGLRWFHVQPLRDRNMTIDLVERAERFGYKALLVTCDNPENSRKYHELRDGFPIPPNFKLGNFSDEVNDILVNDEPNKDLANETNLILYDTSQSWEWIDWLRSISTLPIVLKGITRAEDAREACKHSIQAIQVSSHGGRVPPQYSLPN